MVSRLDVRYDSQVMKDRMQHRDQMTFYCKRQLAAAPECLKKIELRHCGHQQSIFVSLCATIKANA